VNVPLIAMIGGGLSRFAFGIARPKKASAKALSGAA
jgi:hypothetical protein